MVASSPLRTASTDSNCSKSWAGDQLRASCIHGPIRSKGAGRSPSGRQPLQCDLYSGKVGHHVADLPVWAERLNLPLLVGQFVEQAHDRALQSSKLSTAGIDIGIRLGASRRHDNRARFRLVFPCGNRVRERPHVCEMDEVGFSGDGPTRRSCLRNERVDRPTSTSDPRGADRRPRTLRHSRRAGNHVRARSPQSSCRPTPRGRRRRKRAPGGTRPGRTTGRCPRERRRRSGARGRECEVRVQPHEPRGATFASEIIDASASTPSTSIP